MEFQRLAGFPVRQLRGWIEIHHTDLLQLQDDGSGYSSKGKPSELSYWQKSHRPWKDQGLHGGKTLAQFEIEWWSWWKSLQPSEREPNNAEYMQLPTVNMDWTTLHEPGRNGFLLVMVSLAWWGKLAGHSDEWCLAVLDVTVALACLRAKYPVSAPIASTSGTSASCKRKRSVLGQLASTNAKFTSSHTSRSPRKLRKKKV
jgi:hypothetical protein